MIINQNEVIFPGCNESSFTMRIISSRGEADLVGQSPEQPGSVNTGLSLVAMRSLPLALSLVLLPQLLQLHIKSFGGDVAEEIC